MVTQILLLLVMVWYTNVQSAEIYKERLFEDPGLVWLENTDDIIYFQHIYVDSHTWRNKKPPTPVAIARTKKGEHNFTHFTHVDVEGNKTFVMVDSLSQRIMALTFDSLNHYTYTYWELFEGTSSKVNGITVDWVTDVVYWTDAAYDVILAVSMETPNMVEVIVDRDLDEPYGIITYPEKGFLFWTDASESKPRLMRSSLGGRNIFMVLSFLNLRPTTLYIDYMEDRLYWLYERKGDEAGVHGFGSCDPFGKDVRSHDMGPQSNYYDMNIFNGQLVFLQADNARENAHIRFYKPNSYELGFRLPIEGWSNSLLILDPERQSDIYNPCLNSNCPGVCTKSNSSEDCFCNEILKQSASDRTIRMYCTAKSFKGLLLPKGDGIFTMKTNFADYKSASSKAQMKPLQIFGQGHRIKHRVRSLTSDIRASKIFFYEYSTKIIKSVRMEDNTEAEVFSLAVGDVGGLAFDSFTRNLYWTDMFLGHIMVAREDGAFPHVLYRNLKQPKAIAVHSAKRLLFWSELHGRTLKGSYLDGSEPSAVLSLTGYEIYDITIDFSTNKLYWCGIGSLFEANLNGSNVRLLYSNDQHQFTGVTIMHDYLVVSDTGYRTSGLYAFSKEVDGNGTIQSVGSATYPYLIQGNWYGVSYHHTSNQPDGISACTLRNLNCDQLCLPGRRSIRCVCSLGYNTDGSNCTLDIPYKPFLLLTDQRYEKLLQIHAVTRQYVAIKAQGLRQPLAITYDPIKEMVYWSDLDIGTISRVSLKGENQEVLVYDPQSYFTSLALDPGSRLLYYLVRPKPSRGLYGSLVVYNVDTGKTMVLVDKALENALGLTLNAENGYAFLTEEDNIWRVNMNGTDFVRVIDNAFSTAIATTGQHIYFSRIKPARNYYEVPTTQIVRCDLNGDNITLLLNFQFSTISSLTVDKDSIYWTNSSTRGVQRSRLEEPFIIEEVGPSKMLIRPAGIFVNPIGNDFESDCSMKSCLGLCLPSPDGAVCEDKVFTQTVDIKPDNATAELCRIPNIQYGDVIGNIVNRVVPNGYKAKVKCYPAHRISRDEPITCRNGEWSHIPRCTLEYSICGTPTKGYKVYQESGNYFVYPKTTQIDVICVGGGGGGYDVTNELIVKNRKAGDGGDSSFGGYLNAFGGRGATSSQGGKGGFGHSKGGSGSISSNCSTGGTAGQSQPSSTEGRPGYSHDLFCGAGGYSYECNGNSEAESETLYAGPGGGDGNQSTAGYFGGGAGGRGGGTGGGAGWSRLVIPLPAKEVVAVTVGEAGNPSYGFPGPGLVVVMWGDFRADDFVDEHDVINKCVL